jgi:hypothetical protein
MIWRLLYATGIFSESHYLISRREEEKLPPPFTCGQSFNADLYI